MLARIGPKRQGLLDRGHSLSVRAGVPPMTDDQDLIWVEEARFKYNHSREWFNRRVDRGLLKVYYLPGTPKKYLKRTEIEAYFRAHPEEDGQ
jgi:hypothetical protein